MNTCIECHKHVCPHCGLTGSTEAICHGETCSVCQCKTTSTGTSTQRNFQPKLRGADHRFGLLLPSAEFLVHAVRSYRHCEGPRLPAIQTTRLQIDFQAAPQFRSTVQNPS